MDVNRLKRIESLIQTELAKIIHSEIEGSILQWVTITGVRVSADLSYAKIYVVFRQEADVKKTIKLLNQKSKFLRYQLSEKIRNLRKIPEIHFYYDDSIDTGNRIDQLLKETATVK